MYNYSDRMLGQSNYSDPTMGQSKGALLLHRVALGLASNHASQDSFSFQMNLLDERSRIILESINGAELVFPEMVTIFWS